MLLPVIEHGLCVGGHELALRVRRERAVARVGDAVRTLHREPPVARDREVVGASGLAQRTLAAIRRDLGDARAEPELPDGGAGLELVDEQRWKCLADRGVALEAGRGRVGEVVRNDILSDLIREHP